MKIPWKLSAGLLIVTIAGASLFGCGDSKSASNEQGTIVEVQRGTLISTVNAIGNISMPHQTNLTFGSSGTVNEVKVSFGDKVKSGDVLAQLDTASLERAVTQAEANLRTAQINLDKTKQPYTAGDIAKAQAAVESAKAALAAAEDASDNPYTAADIAKAQAAVDSAAASLASAEQDLKDTQDSLIADAEAAVATARIALDNAQRSLTVAQNTGGSNITDAENSASDAQKAYDSYVQTNVANLTRADIAAQKDRLLWTAQKAQTNVDNVKLQADASIATAGNNVTTAQNSLQSAQTNLAQMKDNPPAIRQKQSAVVTASAALDKAREDQASITADPVAVQQRKSQVATAKATLVKAQEDLATIQAGPDTQDIDLKQIQVDNAQVALDDVKEQLERATIVAPFDGVVASVGATAGDQVPVNTNTVIVVLVDTTKAEVDATVDEIDVANVKAGQTAAITLDALPDVGLRGTVTAVSPIAQTQSGVVTYKLAIAIAGGPPPGGPPSGTLPPGGPLRGNPPPGNFPPGSPPLGGSGGRPGITPPNAGGYDLKAGMTASANIIVLNKPDVLLVPSSAITRNGRDSVVQVLAADGNTEQRVVQKGATDGTQTEIVSGLSEGEKVVITATTATTSSQNLGMFRMFGPGGPPPGGPPPGGGGGRP